MDTFKVFGKIQHPFVIENSHKLGIEKNFNLVKNTYEKVNWFQILTFNHHIETWPIHL